MDVSSRFLIGIWGVAMVITFIQAVRLSYRVEARSADLTNTSALPRNAMIFHVIFNIGVAPDPETQAMRRQMIRLLLANAGGFAMLAIYLFVTGRAE